MNIAIVIGVSTYSHDHEIAAPKEDAERIKKLVDATGKYNKILYIVENTLAATVKDKIRSFLQSYQTDQDQNLEIEEVFYYFSGHGKFHDQEFYMLCSDFEKSKLKMTSLQNSEIDDFIRQLNPKLTVKVIDACFSGYRYLKDDSRNYYGNFSSENQLKDVIIMASSHDDQKSQMMGKDSYFTTKFIEGALSVNIGGKILYRDIQAFIADEFNCMTSQIPFFTNQGKGTEVFAKYTDEMKALKEELYPENIQAVVVENLNNNQQDRLLIQSEYMTEEKLIEKIDLILNQKDSLFLDKKLINESILNMKNNISNYQVSDQIVNKFYQLDLDFSQKLSYLSGSSELLQMADIEEWSKEYLIRVNYKKITVKSPTSNFYASNFPRLFGLEDDMREVEKPKSLAALNSLSSEVINLVLQPINKLSLNLYFVIIALVHSETHIMTLSARGIMIKDGWQKYSPDWNSLTWERQKFLWKEIVHNTDALWRVFLDETIQEIREYLMSIL